MPFSNSETTLTFAAPTDILVFDPCYLFGGLPEGNGDVWDSLCNEWYRGGVEAANKDKGAICYKDAKFLYSSTAYGDGSYRISFLTSGVIVGKNELPIDAGTLCVAAKEDVLRILPGFNMSLGTLVANFQGDITSTGTGFSGDLVVITDGSDDAGLDDDDDRLDEEFDEVDENEGD